MHHTAYNAPPSHSLLIHARRPAALSYSSRSVRKDQLAFVWGLGQHPQTPSAKIRLAQAPAAGLVGALRAPARNAPANVAFKTPNAHSAQESGPHQLRPAQLRPARSAGVPCTRAVPAAPVPAPAARTAAVFAAAGLFTTAGPPVRAAAAAVPAGPSVRAAKILAPAVRPPEAEAEAPRAAAVRSPRATAVLAAPAVLAANAAAVPAPWRRRPAR